MSANATVSDPSTLTAVQTAKATNFKATIAVASVYAALCLGLLLIAIFSRTGRTLLTDNYFPFVVTFVLCVIAVSGVIVWLIFSTKTEPSLVVMNGSSCPDYYKTKQWTAAEQKASNMLNENVPYSAFSCQPNLDVISSPLSLNQPSPATVYSTNLTNMLTNFNKGVAPTDNMYMSCSNIYPMYTAYWDTSNFPTPNSGLNSARCELARECGITWTSVCPHYTT